MPIKATLEKMIQHRSLSKNRHKGFSREFFQPEWDTSKKDEYLYMLRYTYIYTCTHSQQLNLIITESRLEFSITRPHHSHYVFMKIYYAITSHCVRWRNIKPTSVSALQSLPHFPLTLAREHEVENVGGWMR